MTASIAEPPAGARRPGRRAVATHAAGSLRAALNEATEAYPLEPA